MQKIVSTLASVADCSLTSPTSSHTRKGAMARSKVTGGFDSAFLPNARTCEPSYGSGEGEMAGDNLYVGKAAKSGRPTTRGTILTPKGEKMLAERERARESELTATPSAFFERRGVFFHAKCKTEMDFLGFTAYPRQYIFWCGACIERFYLPSQVLGLSE